jgi:hypothetical protein
MLKTFGLFNYCKKNFSQIKKYVTPMHSQEYYNTKFYQRLKDRVKYNKI